MRKAFCSSKSPLVSSSRSLSAFVKITQFSLLCYADQSLLHSSCPRINGLSCRIQFISDNNNSSVFLLLHFSFQHSTARLLVRQALLFSFIFSTAQSFSQKYCDCVASIYWTHEQWGGYAEVQHVSNQMRMTKNRWLEGHTKREEGHEVGRYRS